MKMYVEHRVRLDPYLEADLNKLVDDFHLMSKDKKLSLMATETHFKSTDQRIKRQFLMLAVLLGMRVIMDAHERGDLQDQPIH